MASIQTKISKLGGDNAEVLFRFKASHQIKTEYHTGIIVNRASWSDKTCKLTTNAKVCGSDEQADKNRKTNTQLTELRANLLEHYDALADKPNSTADLRQWVMAETNKLLHPENYAPKQSKPTTLFGCVDTFLANLDNRIVQGGGKRGQLLSNGTKVAYRQSVRWLHEFAESKRKKDFKITDVDASFYNAFLSYMYAQGVRLNTAGKHIKHLKAILHTLPQQERNNCGLIASGSGCMVLKEDVDNIALTKAEIAQLADYKPQCTFLEHVRDAFVLLCWTGCRYSDLGKLTKQNIVELGGEKFFKIRQQKTQATVFIPIFDEAKAILEKYDYIMPKPMTNQVFNRNLHDVCEAAGLCADVTLTRTVGGKSVATTYKQYEVISAHTARRSFATNAYKDGYPTLMIMKITGHKDEKTFLKYVKVTEQENAEMMMRQYRLMRQAQAMNA